MYLTLITRVFFSLIAIKYFVCKKFSYLVIVYMYLYKSQLIKNIFVICSKNDFTSEFMITYFSLVFKSQHLNYYKIRQTL